MSCGCKIVNIGETDWSGPYPTERRIVQHCTRHSESAVAELEQALAAAKEDRDSQRRVAIACLRESELYRAEVLRLTLADEECQRSLERVRAELAASNEALTVQRENCDELRYRLQAWQDAEAERNERYKNDATFAAIVDVFRCHFESALPNQITPTEVREAAMLAMVMYEERHIRPILFPRSMIGLPEEK